MKRKFSDFSASNVSESDLGAMLTKKQVSKEDAMKTFCRIRPDKNNIGKLTK
jgi:hypothetical protein